MAKISNLLGGDGNAYVSENYHALAKATSAGNLTLDRLYLFPFMVRKPVTIDEVFWYRNNTTAANMYVGIMLHDGNVLTDCPVDADTDVGIHSAPTSDVDLTPDKSYILGVNPSATFQVGQIYTNSSDEFAANSARNAGHASLPGYQYPTWYVPRTAAALTGTIDLTTGAVEAFNVGWGGFRVK